MNNVKYTPSTANRGPLYRVAEVRYRLRVPARLACHIIPYNGQFRSSCSSTLPTTYHALGSSKRVGVASCSSHLFGSCGAIGVYNSAASLGVVLTCCAQARRCYRKIKLDATRECSTRACTCAAPRNTGYDVQRRKPTPFTLLKNESAPTLMGSS